jgi:hypothetical protein
MLIKTEQFVAFENNKVNEFKRLQVTNLLDKFDQRELDNSLESNVSALVDVAFKYGLTTDVEVESFILICFHHKISLDHLESNRTIDEIFTYPDRINDDKLYHFFQYLSAFKKTK